MGLVVFVYLYRRMCFPCPRPDLDPCLFFGSSCLPSPMLRCGWVSRSASVSLGVVLVFPRAFHLILSCLGFSSSSPFSHLALCLPRPCHRSSLTCLSLSCLLPCFSSALFFTPSWSSRMTVQSNISHIRSSLLNHRIEAKSSRRQYSKI